MVPPSPADPPKMSAAQKRTTLQRGQYAMTSTVASAAESAAAAAATNMGLRVDIYQLQVPFGTISRHEQFWKHVDENAVDVGTYDLLLKNGVRVGQAPIAEWEFFRDLMAQFPAVTKVNTLVAAENKPVELPVRKDLVSQVLFFFDAQNRPIGQSFDACENFIALTVQHAPRKPQTMRVALCPTVRAKQKRLEWSPRNNELEVTYTAPQRMYDLNLRTDVPVDRFLIVAPSGEASWPTSIGSNFFVTDGTAERMENIFLIVPAAVRIEPGAAPPAAAK